MPLDQNQNRQSDDRRKTFPMKSLETKTSARENSMEPSGAEVRIEES